MGLPNGGDPYGDGIPIVLGERESRLQGEVGYGGKAVRKSGMERVEMAAMKCQSTTVRRRRGNMPLDRKPL
jgi:hypothetical protein